MINNKKLLLSPLRYPGGKHALVPLLAEFLNTNKLAGKDFVEPFAGGAAVALNLVHLGVVQKATIVERDPLIYAFWKCVKDDPGIICDKILKLDVSLATWRDWQPLRELNTVPENCIIPMGLAGLFYNRTNFSGIIDARPIGGFGQNSKYSIDCRFPKETLIERICALSDTMKKICVIHADAISYLQRAHQRLKSNNVPVYVDPPYYGQGKRLYRYHFNDQQHRRLAKHLDTAGYPWLVSYDDTPFIKSLFEHQKIVPIFLRYAVREARRADELLITNQKHLPILTAQRRPSAVHAADRGGQAVNC